MCLRVALLALLSSALEALAITHTQTPMPICRAYQGGTYAAAKQLYPDLQDAIDVVQEQGIVAWYTDNMDAASRSSMLSTLATCDAATKIPMVVYGIPRKDCEANYSNAGSNKDMDDYKAFITTLTATFPTQHMVYIVEPDAVGLTANGGCGVANEYPTYLSYALEQLSTNPNAELFLDIGFWTLLPSGHPQALAEVVNTIWPINGRVNGIALNTANYQTTSDMLQLCDLFATLTDRPNMSCVIDTSRNNRGPSTKGEWCNYKHAGIGVPPTMDTGHPRAAYFLWVKPPGESDGTCGAQTSGDARIGPVAGAFFKEQFETLWENGYFMENDTTAARPTPTPTIMPKSRETPTPTSSTICKLKRRATRM